MIEEGKGNLLEAEAEALVNTVNCVGFMGKGIALQFKQAFPENYDAYHRACDAGEVQPGRMFVFRTNSVVDPKYIINFPTKRHWRGKSKIEDIEAGLASLIEEVRRLGINSIAVPPLGCGLGGLRWSKVRPMIAQAFEQLPDVHVFLFAPHGDPDAKAMPVHTKVPNMTLARALFIKLMEQYLGLAYRLTLLEVQKLAYFLQESGEPLKLKYVAHIYGPYADNLNHVLQAIEGHFTRGFGDSPKPDRDIELLPGAVEAANAALDPNSESYCRLQKVGELIEGFETPYGMELMSSVHWVACHGDQPAKDEASAVAAVHGWNDRKRTMFQPAHIAVAWRRLAEARWLPAGN
ncbi:MAG: macro domain-containing protein [Planctomycetes bacterium]|nr:macro domain-containing protein [Planctomycetota bacterium]